MELNGLKLYEMEDIEEIEEKSKDKEILNRKRSREEIIEAILHLAKPGMKKTHILYRSNLSVRRLDQYLTVLIKRGLLEEKKAEGRAIYQTTYKGNRFLLNHKRLSKLIGTF